MHTHFSFCGHHDRNFFHNYTDIWIFVNLSSTYKHSLGSETHKNNPRNADIEYFEIFSFLQVQETTVTLGHIRNKTRKLSERRRQMD